LAIRGIHSVSRRWLDTEYGELDTYEVLMATKRITAKVVDDMASGDVVFDTDVRGFLARHRGGGVHYAVKTRIRREQRILTIGRHGRGAWGPESARREAQRLLGLIRDGRDPAAQRAADKAAPTLSSFAARYMMEYAANHHRPRTLSEDARLLRLYVLPTVGKLRLRDIGKAEAARMHTGLSATPVSANRALGMLSAILGWAERVGERGDGTNPCRHVDRYPEKARERLLSADELARLGETLAIAETAGISDWRPVAMVRLLLFTGGRLSEILGLRWEWIDMTAGTVRLPDSKTGAKTIHLPAPAQEMLAALPRFAGNAHVIPGDRPGAPFVGAQKAWGRIRARAELPDLRLHDLRHAFASTAVAGGDSIFIVGKLLGHSRSATTDRYAHLAPDPAAAVANRTAARLQAMLGGQTGEVVSIDRTKSNR
jgi:integrase